MRYNFGKIEKKWSPRWVKDGIYEPSFSKAKRPFYNLMMFPYPSAEGLHVGNMYAFTGSDIYGRLKRMQGHDVFEPIGLDGFGIHSENYAMKIGAHPANQAKVSQKHFYKQLQMVGNGFAWEEKLETYDPDYYKWTQWIFAEMFRKGLAYRKKAPVNWCVSCKTVLADEQVIDGKCERCESDVIKKELAQWFFKITKYAPKLLRNLEKIDWSERVKIAQKHWIGESEGAEITFEIDGTGEELKVFTTRPDTLFGATYMVLAPEHPLVEKLKNSISNYKSVEAYVKKTQKKSERDRLDETKAKTGAELKGLYAVNPANKKKIPIWISDYVLATYGTGAIMAVPAHDERDFEFAKKFNLKIISVLKNTEGMSKLPYIGTGVMRNSGKFDGMTSEKAKEEITKFVGGKLKKQYRLRDWLISRQRYWGPPIPMIYCEVCADKGVGEQKEMPGWYAVPTKDLPVVLPYIKNFRPQGKGESPLASSPTFYKTTCPKCKKPARRETDVSDTFLDSSWYYLRYPSVRDKRNVWNPTTTKKWLPVDMYIGGAEHSVLHLLYSRFLAMVFKDWELTDFEEPFTQFRAHGLLIKEGAKMSKSKGNVVNPDEYIKEFGADALRTHLMFLGPFEQGGDFRDSGIIGVTRFLNRTWDYGQREIKRGEVSKWLHRSIKKVTEDIEGLRYNTAISELMIVLNNFEGDHPATRKDFEVFLKMLAPFAPFLAEELWSQLGNKQSIHLAAWPTYNTKAISEEAFDLVVQVNGKVRATVRTDRGISQKEAEDLALEEKSVLKFLDGKPPKRIIFVKDRLINFVV